MAIGLGISGTTASDGRFDMDSRDLKLHHRDASRGFVGPWPRNLTVASITMPEPQACQCPAPDLSISTSIPPIRC